MLSWYRICSRSNKITTQTDWHRMPMPIETRGVNGRENVERNRVSNSHNWPYRSMCVLCTVYANTNHPPAPLPATNLQRLMFASVRSMTIGAAVHYSTNTRTHRTYRPINYTSVGRTVNGMRENFVGDGEQRNTKMNQNTNKLWQKANAHWFSVFVVCHRMAPAAAASADVVVVVDVLFWAVQKSNTIRLFNIHVWCECVCGKWRDMRTFRSSRTIFVQLNLVLQRLNE